jgi:hypothetical protein
MYKMYLDTPDKRPVVDVAVDAGHHRVDDEDQEVAVVSVAYAGAGKPAVVVSLQHAHVAGRTVVGAGGTVLDTGWAVTETGTMVKDRDMYYK